MKAKTVAIFFTALLIVSGIGVLGMPNATISNKEVQKITKTLSFSSPSMSEEDDYLSLSVPEASSYILTEGTPIMPMATKTFTFPLGTEIVDVSCDVGAQEKYYIQKKIIPASSPVPVGDVVSSIDVWENEEIYSSHTPFPNKWCDFTTGGGLVDGRRVTLLTVTIFPVQYIPAEGVLSCARDIEISVIYKEVKPTSLNEEYDLLILAPSEFSNALMDLVEYKNGMGAKTTLVSLEEVDKVASVSFMGRDQQEDIKYYIKDAIERWGVTYVMLVGDYKKIPPRYAEIPSGDYEDNFPSDLYYADIYNSDATFASWDTDGDGKFAEFRDDKVDLNPDVYLGRLACENEKEVETVVKKIITYEESTVGQSWFNTIVVCGGDTFTSDDGDKSGIYEGEYATGEVLKVMSDFTPIKLWASEGTLSTNGIIDTINDGAGFIDFSGHGNQLSWATHPPDDQSEWIGISTTDLAGVSNDDKLPVVFLDACSCSKFDYKWKACLGWEFVRKENGGAIATLGASGIGYGSYGYNQIESVMGWMEFNFFKYYAEGAHVIGEIWNKCITGYKSSHFPMDREDYKTCEELALLGDPSLMIGGRGAGKGRAWISSPKNGYFYLFGQEKRQTISGNTIIIGGITIEVSATLSDITVEFYVDDSLKFTDNEGPYEWSWDERVVGTHSIKITAYDDEGYTMSDEIVVKVFNI